MTVEQKVDLINGDYTNKVKEFYPFISKERITILKQGYYKKQKSNYRGLGVVYDKFHKKEKVILLGYYFVDKDYIVIPKDLHITENKQKLIDDYAAKGFISLIGEFPKLKPIEFSENTEEYQLTIERKKNFIKKK